MSEDPELDPSLDDPRQSNGHSEREEAAWRKVIRVKQATLAIVIVLLIINIVGGTLFFLRLNDTIEAGTNTIEAIRETQQAGSPTQQRLVAISEQLLDLARQIDSCTNGKGDCAKKGQEQTAEAVAGIIAGNSDATKDIISAALSCQADGFTEKPELLDCTIQRSK